MTNPDYTPPTVLAGSTALIAGAAGAIGQAIARRLSTEGVRLMLLDADDAALSGLATELANSGEVVPHSGTDLTDAAAVTAAVQAAQSHFGAIEIVVNCVGITGETGKRSHEVPIQNFEHVLNVNLRAAFLLSAAVFPVMLSQKYGRVVHLASIAGKEGNAGMVSYSASKAGLIGMVKAQGKEYATDGITVNALAPAVIWSQMVAGMPDAQVKYMTDRIPMGRLGTAEEAAHLVAFVVSPAASFCTGFTFDLSGGRATY